MRTLIRKCQKLLKLVPNRIYRKGLAAGIGAAVEHTAAMRSIDFACALDVGANVGQFTLLLRAVKPDAEVHAFEPLGAPAASFRQLFANDPKVHLYPIAAGEVPGSVEIHVSGKIDSSSILPITKAQSSIFPGTEEVGRESVSVRRIDDVIDLADLKRPILVKLDVQGFELSALRGMPRLLEMTAYIYAELSFVEFYEGQPLASEIIEWISQQGFDLVGIYNGSFASNGQSVQVDALFARRKIS